MSDSSTAFPPLRVLCFGVGAIGTYLGGSLALAGNRVVFIERPEIASQVRANGLSLQQGDLIRRLPQPEVADSIAAALAGAAAEAPFDVCLLAIKAYDTPAFAESLRPYLGQLPPLLSFQNGVENEPRLAVVLGAENVIAGTVTTAIGRHGAGQIGVERLRGIGISATHPLSPRLIHAANAAGLRATAYPNPAAMKWSKMLTNLLANASSAILDFPPAAIFDHAGLFDLEMRQLHEALAVMHALGIPVTDLPATPVRLLTFVAGLPRWLSRPLLRRALGSGRGTKMPSFHIDLYAGRPQSEVDDLNGAVVRFGQQLGIPTPVNRALTRLLLRLTGGELPLSTFAHQPQKLLDAVEKLKNIEN